MNRRIITRTVLLVSLVSLFTDISSEMLYPVMPVYLKSIHFSVLLILVLEGIAELTAGLSKGYFGNLSDKRGERMPFVRWGYVLSTISKPLLVTFAYPVWIFCIRTMDRLGKGIRTSAKDALLSDETTKENKAKVFGFHRALDTVGAAIGPVIALLYLLIYPGEYYWLFIIAFFPGLMAVGITFFVREKKKAHTGTGKSTVGFLDFLKYWGKSSPVYKRLVIGLLFFTILNSSDALLLLWLNKSGLSDTAVIGFYIFYNLIYALASYPLGMFADRMGMKKALMLGLILFAVVYFSFGFAILFWQFAILFFLYGIYAAATEGVSKAWISNMSKAQETATAIGFYNSMSSIFSLLANMLAGLLCFYFSFTASFVVSGIGVALVVVYLSLMVKEKFEGSMVRR